MVIVQYLELGLEVVQVYYKFVVVPFYPLGPLGTGDKNLEDTSYGDGVKCTDFVWSMRRFPRGLVHKENESTGRFEKFISHKVRKRLQTSRLRCFSGVRRASGDVPDDVG